MEIITNLNTLNEGGINWIEEVVGVKKSKFYHYPTIRNFEKAAVKIPYLGPVWNDWSNDEIQYKFTFDVIARFF